MSRREKILLFVMGTGSQYCGGTEDAHLQYPLVKVKWALEVNFPFHSFKRNLISLFV